MDFRRSLILILALIALLVAIVWPLLLIAAMQEMA
jgi:hypothetical protein